MIRIRCLVNGSSKTRLFGFSYVFGVMQDSLLTTHLFLNMRQIVQIHNIQNPQRVYQIAIIAFLLAYWVQGLFNDFVIGSAPIHWILLGSGISLYHFREEKQPISTDKKV